MRQNYDVIIAGSGVAGLHAALCLDRSLRVLVLSKKDPSDNNSALAQGGVAAVLNPAQDSEPLHFNDTMVAGGHTNNPDAVRVLVHEGPANVLSLLGQGVDFDRNADGSLNLTLEGGHSRRRIAHHRDNTGYELVIRLLGQVRQRENIELLGGAALVELFREDGGFRASVCRDGRFFHTGCRFFIMATGGIGRVFRYTTNSDIATGDGIYLAKKLGARIRGLSLVQFHPTAFAGGSGPQRFLISESVRGEGAVLLNGEGRRFMQDYDSRGELAPRDVVSKAVMAEARRTGSEHFTLDITHEDADFVRNRFPGIYAKCLESGVDITRDRIPVFPCQHYLMGGIDVDTCARTTVPGLYAVGECSHTGVHGNNRLASNSLLEALVFSRRAAQDILARAGGSAPQGPRGEFEPHGGPAVAEGTASGIREAVQRSFFVTPDPAQAARDLPRIREIRETLEQGTAAPDPALLEIRSLAGIAEQLLEEVTES